MKDTDSVDTAARAMKSIAVLGEIPFSGRALVRALLARGLSARVLCAEDKDELAVREAAAEFPGATVEVIRGDLDSKTALNGIFDGAYGAVYLSPITLQGRMHRPHTHLDDVRRVIEAGKQHATRKLVYHSALGADPLSSSQALREAALAEDLVHASKCQDYRVRTAPLMGRGDGFLVEILNKVKSPYPIASMMGGGDTPVQPLHVDDMARCVCRIFIHEPDEVVPGVFKLAGPETATLLDLTGMAERRLGRTRVRIHIPVFLLKFASSMTPRDLRFKERVGLLFNTFYTDKNDALDLIAPGEKLITPKQAQEELLKPA